MDDFPDAGGVVGSILCPMRRAVLSLWVDNSCVEGRASRPCRAPDNPQPPSRQELSVSAVPIADQPSPSAAVAAFLKRKPRLFIGGEWVEPKDSAAIDVIDPATGSRVSTIADATTEDVDRAVKAARAALESSAWA